MDPLLAFGFWAFVLTVAGVFAIFTLGLQVEVGDAGLINFGHVAFMAIGAYAMGLALIAGYPVWLGVPWALICGAVAGVLLGIPTLRLRADYFAITSIAAAEIVRITILNEQETTGGSLGLRQASGPWRDFNDDVLAFFSDLGIGLDRRVPLLVMVWVAAGLVALLLWYLGKTPWRRVLRAVRENEEAAAAVGKPVFAYKLQALALGSAIAALAGVFFTLQNTTLFPENFEPIVTFLAFAILILGGFGSYLGVVVGAIVISFIFAGTRFLDFPGLESDEVAALRLVVIGLIIMALMAFRPQGLFGKKEELHLDA
ncbi:MAG: branched-chain amino acid ABC transporter permease [Thermoleophilia bacterium]|nr:branched-chain amino acid ABC transporter permease [Thermoleophilia bacterium]MDH3724699.1 branched-chain amino acid ABC transporter permease [Thermoleophilia bacterium]